MESIILNHIHERRYIYRTDEDFLENECINRFSTNDSVFASINNRADILATIISKVDFQMPLYYMVNKYYYKESCRLLKNIQ